MGTQWLITGQSEKLQFMTETSGLSYASRLTPKSEKGGGMGGPEHQDRPEEIAKKTVHFAELLKESKSCVVITGAGISTSAGVADFRGPNGVWTAEKQGRPPPKCVSFDHANPTLTHMALVRLVDVGLVKLVVSQNVDGLHMRSGLARDRLAELHGNLFLETCEVCGTEYLRDFDIGGISFKKTGRFCEKPDCGGALRDTLLDWDDALPESDLIKAQSALRDCDLCVCLGTSLRIRPASELPVQAVRRGAKLVICNLQKTPKDRHAYLNIHAPVDDVLRGVTAMLNLSIPSFTRKILLSVVVRSYRGADGVNSDGHNADRKSDEELEILVQSSVGVGCNIPMMRSCRVLSSAATSAELSLDIRQAGPPWSFKCRDELGLIRLGVHLLGEPNERHVSLPLPSPFQTNAVLPLALEGSAVDYASAVRSDEVVARLMGLAAQVDRVLWGQPDVGVKRRNEGGEGESASRRRGRVNLSGAVTEERKDWVQCHNKDCQRWFRKPTLPHEPQDAQESTTVPKVLYCRRRCSAEAQAFEMI